MLAIKPVKAVTGAQGMLADLIASEASADAGVHAEHDAASHSVPGLALDKVRGTRFVGTGRVFICARPDLQPSCSMCACQMCQTEFH